MSEKRYEFSVARNLYIPDFTEMIAAIFAGKVRFRDADDGCCAECGKPYDE